MPISSSVDGSGVAEGDDPEDEPPGVTTPTDGGVSGAVSLRPGGGAVTGGAGAGTGTGAGAGTGTGAGTGLGDGAGAGALGDVVAGGGVASTTAVVVVPAVAFERAPGSNVVRDRSSLPALEFMTPSRPACGRSR